jgi:hypothetical protein
MLEKLEPVFAAVFWLALLAVVVTSLLEFAGVL